MVSMHMKLEITTPVEKFWKKISTALAVSKKIGSIPTCRVNGTNPPTTKRMKPV